MKPIGRGRSYHVPAECRIARLQRQLDDATDELVAIAIYAEAATIGGLGDVTDLRRRLRTIATECREAQARLQRNTNHQGQEHHHGGSTN